MRAGRNVCFNARLYLNQITFVILLVLLLQEKALSSAFFRAMCEEGEHEDKDGDKDLFNYV